MVGADASKRSPPADPNLRREKPCEKAVEKSVDIFAR